MTETLEANIAQQPASIARLLAQRDTISSQLASVAGRAVRKVVFVGSGTSLYAGEIAAGVWSNLHDVDAWAVPTLPFLNSVAGRLDRTAVVVAISQSGGTLALVEGVARARTQGALTIAVTADPTSPVARASDVTIDSTTGHEAIFAKTRGFLTTSLAACLAGRHFVTGAGAPSPDRLARFDEAAAHLANHAQAVIDEATSRGDEFAAHLGNSRALAVVGAGPLWPAASEGALKILEVAKMPVMAYELEESQHGPFNAFDSGTGLILLAGRIPQVDRLRAFERGAEYVGAPLMTVAERSAFGASPQPPRSRAAQDLVLPDLADPNLAPLLAILPLQVVAARLAVYRRVDPNSTRYPGLYGVFRTKAGHGEEVD